MAQTAALSVLGTLASTGFGIARQVQQQQYQTAVYEQQRQQAERQRAAAERNHAVQQRALSEQAAHDRQISLLTFERGERERLRKLRRASGTLAADASARGVVAGGSAAAIQRGLESEADSVAEQAAEDRSLVERERERSLAYNRYDLERQRYASLTGIADDSAAAALRHGYRQRRSLLDFAERRTRERLGLFADLAQGQAE